MLGEEDVGWPKHSRSPYPKSSAKNITTFGGGVSGLDSTALIANTWTERMKNRVLCKLSISLKFNRPHTTPFDKDVHITDE